MEAASIKSKHARLLNTLDTMIHSPVYKFRQAALMEAETLILSQEQEITKLTARIADLEAPVKASLL